MSWMKWTNHLPTISIQTPKEGVIDSNFGAGFIKAQFIRISHIVGSTFDPPLFE